MSIKAISRVWDSGAYDGTRLVLVLALADWANDRGGDIFPSVGTMARKIRKETRVVQHHLRALEGDGVLTVEAEAVGSKPREYRLDLDRLAAIGADQDLARRKRRTGGRKGVQSGAPQPVGVQSGAPHDGTARGAIERTEGVQPIAGEGCNPLHPVIVNRQLSVTRTPASPVENAEPPGTEKNGLAPGARARMPTRLEIEREAERLEGFAAFAVAYPKMQRRPRARRAFEKALGKASAAAIIRGARRYATKVRNGPERFIAFPANWLDDEGWRDFEDASGDTPASTAADDEFKQRLEATIARLERESQERFRQWDAEAAAGKGAGGDGPAAETGESE